jgi:hypothetical protein
MYSEGMFLDVKNGWHAGADERENEFRGSLGAWVDAHDHDADDKAMAERVSKHVRYVTHGEFRTAFEKSVNWAIDAIIMNSSNNSFNNNSKSGEKRKVQVWMMASAHKSSAWLSRVAWDIIKATKYKSSEKTKYIELGGYIEAHDEDGVSQVTNNPKKQYQTGGPKDQHVLFCDDASYSGAQLYAILKHILRNHLEKHGSSRIWKDDTQHLHVYVAIPFMSTFSYDKFLKLQRSLLWAHRAVSGTMESGTEISYQKHKRDFRLTLHLNPVAPENVIRLAWDALDESLRVQEASTRYMTGTSLTTFNHKTPDSFSFFKPLRDGRLIRGGKFSGATIDRVPFLDQVRRAYGN